MKNGKWIAGRRINGDELFESGLPKTESRHVESEVGAYPVRPKDSIRNVLLNCATDAKTEDRTALADDFRTFLLTPVFLN